MLLGRGVETATIDGLLGDARSGRGAALVLRGEAGVGKSALLEHARAAADGFTVLQAVGIESEAELAFAGLHQLLHPVLDRLAELPAPQAAAIRAAFGLSDETVAERFRISLGALGLLAAAAESNPVLCVVDDAQWLDEASAAALLFVARRVEAERVVLLFAARDGTAQSFPAPGLPDLAVSALRSEDARELATERLGLQASAAAVEWVLANAGGNPLALIELPRGLSADQIDGREPLTDIARSTTSIERAFLERVAGLPRAVQEWLIVIAAEETGDRATIRAAAEALGLDEAELAAAESSGLVRVEPNRVVFGHPLMRSAVYRGAPFLAREGAHRALADVLTRIGDLDRRAWHLALSTSGTNDDVAADLEATADRAQQRAGYASAASAFERAAALSGQAPDRTRRTLRAARSAWQAGQRDRAVTLLDLVSRADLDPLLRAERAHVRGLIDIGCGSQHAAGSGLISAADEVAAHDPHVALELLLDAGLAAGRAGNAALMADVGRRARTLPGLGELDRAARDLLVGVGSLTTGLSVADVPMLRSAVGAAAQHDDPRVLGWAAFAAAALGLPGVDAALARSIEAARTFGAVPAVVLILETMVVGSNISGRYTLSAEAEEGLRLASEVGLTNAAIAFRATLSWSAALRGDEQTCQRYAAEVAAGASSGMAMASSIARRALALLDLSLGRPEQAAARLAALRSAPVGEAHPLWVLMSTADLVEALQQAGRTGEAVAAAAAAEEFAQPDAPTWAHALAARCRAMLADGDEAIRNFDAAVRLLENANRPFDRARTQLALGGFLRRQRRRADARECLRAAMQTFEQLGAEPWAERARVELRATGETARKRDPSTLTQLTPQEAQIARLVGDGKSNKDVAAQLFLSPRTVEYHLAKVFAKLGITSRAELIRRRDMLAPVG